MFAASQKSFTSLDDFSKSAKYLEKKPTIPIENRDLTRYKRGNHYDLFMSVGSALIRFLLTGQTEAPQLCR